MKMSKIDLLDLLLKFTDGNSDAISRVALAYKSQHNIWTNAEWIYVKDIESGLKSLKKIHQQGEFEQFVNIKEMILDEKFQTDLIEDNWIKNRILECRQSMHSLYTE